MSPRIAVVGGLLSGVLVAAVVLGGIFALAPDVPVVVASPAPPNDAVASVSPTPGPNVTTSASPSLAVSAAPSNALFHIGEPAPALVVPQVGGGTIDLASLEGQPVWVNFMGTYCPPCQDEFPLMNGFAARYAEDGLVILAIDVEEDEGTVAAFAESLSVTFPLGLDVDGSAAADWDALVLPIHFWIDRDGIVRDGALGGIGPDIMARGVGAILPGVTVTP